MQNITPVDFNRQLKTVVTVGNDKWDKSLFETEQRYANIRISTISRNKRAVEGIDLIVQKADLKLGNCLKDKILPRLSSKKHDNVTNPTQNQPLNPKRTNI